MKMPKLEVIHPRSKTISVGGSTLAISIHDTRPHGFLEPIRHSVKCAIDRFKKEKFPLINIIVTGKTLKNVQENMIFAHQYFKEKMGDEKTLLYKKTRNDAPNCYQLVYSYHVTSTPTDDTIVMDKKRTVKPPTQAQKIDQCQTAIIQLYTLHERVVGMAEKMISNNEKKADILQSQVEVNKQLSARCDSLNRGLMFCIMLINVIAWISVMRETGIDSLPTIVTGALTIGVWLGYYGTLLFYWFRKRRAKNIEESKLGSDFDGEPEIVKQAFAELFVHHFDGKPINDDCVRTIIENVRLYSPENHLSQTELAGTQITNPVDFYNVYRCGASIEQCISRFRVSDYG